LANCYKALHRYSQALSAIENLESKFKDDLSEVLKKKADELKTVISSIVGSLTITVDPKESRVTLNGEAVDAHESDAPLLLGPGTYAIEVSNEGFETQTQTVSVKSNETSEVFITLKPAAGRLVVDVDKPGATVQVDGEYRGKTPLSSPVVLSPGTHAVAVLLDGYEPVTRDVTVRADAETVVQIGLVATFRHDRTGAGAEKVPVDTSEKKKPALFPLKITGLVLTIGLGAASAVFWVTADKAASDFETYDTSYSKAKTEAEAEKFYAKREDAYDKNRLYMNLGIGFGVGAGVIGISTLILTLVTRHRGDSHRGDSHRGSMSPNKTALQFQGAALILDF
jgi:hypothetical protein